MNKLNIIVRKVLFEYNIFLSNCYSFHGKIIKKIVIKCDSEGGGWTWKNYNRKL